VGWPARTRSVLQARQGLITGFSTSAGFARSAGTLRWRSKTAVELVPYVGLSAGMASTVLWRDDRGLVTVKLDDPLPSGRPAELPHEEYHDLAADMVDAPCVVVQLPAEGGSRIDVVGGGPANGIQMPT
jgi:hypothetical protein